VLIDGTVKFPAVTCHTLCTVSQPSISVATVLLAVGDPVRTRTVYAAMLFLIAIGAGLVALTIWLVRVTRHEPEYLAPLELMASRRWRRSDPVAQRRMLDEVRPEGAEPLSPSVPPPSGDDEFDLGPRLRSFDDLSADADPPAVTDTGGVPQTVPADPTVALSTTGEPVDAVPVDAVPVDPVPVDAVPVDEPVGVDEPSATEPIAAHDGMAVGDPDTVPSDPDTVPSDPDTVPSGSDTDQGTSRSS
jgi:hypothetical protein